MTSAADVFDLDRFVRAQAAVFPRVLDELRAGTKTSHWMWFVFPQIAGLGMSAMSRVHAISGGAEARAYADHPLLGARLRMCAEAVLGHADKSAAAIFGSVDAAKFRSSMTLFDAAVPDEPLFARCLGAFFGGDPDGATLGLLGLGTSQ